jgi:hypothetical protein
MPTANQSSSLGAVFGVISNFHQESLYKYDSLSLDAVNWILTASQEECAEARARGAAVLAHGRRGHVPSGHVHLRMDNVPECVVGCHGCWTLCRWLCTDILRRRSRANSSSCGPRSRFSWLHTRILSIGLSVSHRIRKRH